MRSVPSRRRRGDAHQFVAGSRWSYRSQRTKRTEIARSTVRGRVGLQLGDRCPNTVVLRRCLRDLPQHGVGGD
ncbi:hypothetical protein [Kribbella sp. NPDC055071]